MTEMDILLTFNNMQNGKSHRGKTHKNGFRGTSIGKLHGRSDHRR